MFTGGIFGRFAEMSRWSMGSVNGWKGLHYGSKDSQLLCRPIDSRQIASPPGFDRKLVQQSAVDEAVASQIENKGADAEQRDIVMNTIAWNVCIAPLKSLPMNAFMMYMIGNQIGIWSIMMCGMTFFRVLQSFTGFKATSTQLENSDNYYLQIVIWVLGQLACLALCIWKCNGMGLLPTHPSDWLTFSTPAQATEFSTDTLF